MFEWEEGTYRILQAIYRKIFVSPRIKKSYETRAILSEHRASLIILGRLVSGRCVNIFETNERKLCIGERICLPTEYNIAPSMEENLEIYRVKTIIGGLVIRENWNGCVQELSVFISSLSLEHPNLLQKTGLLARKFLKHQHSLWETLGSPSTHSPLNTKEKKGGIQEYDLHIPEERITEIEGKGQTEVNLVEENNDYENGADLPIHTFEKTECLEETSGLNRKTDNEDELEQHKEALKEVDIREVVRTYDRPRSIYRSDLILDGLNLEIKEKSGNNGIPYPEWDYVKKKFRKDWCFIQTKINGTEDSTWLRNSKKKWLSLINQLKKEFSRIASEQTRLKQQPLGNEFDIDALIDAQVQINLGQNPNENFYLENRKYAHELCTLILLDLSYSTDSWINERRILDTIRETVLCIGEAIDPYVESFSVAGFSSNTRRCCRYEIIKDFKEPWSQASARLGGLRTEGYTRIGPALRHGQEMLAQQNAKRKSIILVTDGKPCDYDRYEGIYGMKDIRKAIECGRTHSISTHAFAIDKQAAETFPMTFGKKNYNLVRSPKQLTDYMHKLFAQWIRSSS